MPGQQADQMRAEDQHDGQRQELHAEPRHDRPAQIERPAQLPVRQRAHREPNRERSQRELQPRRLHQSRTGTKRSTTFAAVGATAVMNLPKSRWLSAPARSLKDRMTIAGTPNAFATWATAAPSISTAWAP